MWFANKEANDDDDFETEHVRLLYRVPRREVNRVRRRPMVSRASRKRDDTGDAVQSRRRTADPPAAIGHLCFDTYRISVRRSYIAKRRLDDARDRVVQSQHMNGLISSGLLLSGTLQA